MLTPLQKKTALAIVNIFETGSLAGKYGMVTLLAGDTGHLTYGRSQTTLGSGNLFLLIKDYCNADGAQFGGVLTLYLDRLKVLDLSLDRDMEFRTLLKKAGNDPVMRAVQDAFFDRVYWTPAAANASRIGIETPLGVAVVYDSRIHGSWDTIRNRVNRGGSVADLGEAVWVKLYVVERRRWLSTRQSRVLRNTVYRMDAFQELIDAENWALDLPITVRGVRVGEKELGENERPGAPATVTEANGFVLTYNPGVAVEAVANVQGGLNRLAGWIGGRLTYLVEEPLDTDGRLGPKTAKATFLASGRWPYQTPPNVRQMVESFVAGEVA